jgi:hypothetical protein
MEMLFTVADLSILSSGCPQLEALEFMGLYTGDVGSEVEEHPIRTVVPPFPVLNTVVLFVSSYSQGLEDTCASCPSLLTMNDLETLIGMAPALHTLRLSDVESALAVNYYYISPGDTSCPHLLLHCHCHTS